MGRPFTAINVNFKSPDQPAKCPPNLLCFSNLGKLEVTQRLGRTFYQNQEENPEVLVSVVI